MFGAFRVDVQVFDGILEGSVSRKSVARGGNAIDDLPGLGEMPDALLDVHHFLLFVLQFFCVSHLGVILPTELVILGSHRQPGPGKREWTLYAFDVLEILEQGYFVFLAERGSSRCAARCSSESRVRKLGSKSQGSPSGVG